MKNKKDNIQNKDIIYRIIDFSLKHRRIMQNFLEETGVYHAQHRLLMIIARNPNASQIDLAKAMDVSPAAIAVSLKKLEKGGYIKREIVQEDNRLNKITLTDKGNWIVKESKQIFTNVDDAIFKDFTEAEKVTLFSLLEKVGNNINNMEEEIKLKKERK